MEDSGFFSRDKHDFTFASIKSGCLQYTPSINRINICLEDMVFGCRGNKEYSRHRQQGESEFF